MQKVTGIGGFFFKAKDPSALAEWYEKNLGVSRTPRSYDEQPWTQAAGATVFEPFPDSNEMFAGAFMLNFRVDDLDAMVKQLAEADIKVEVDPETYPNGRFASLHDPEGNPIQLWQPA